MKSKHSSHNVFHTYVPQGHESKFLNYVAKDVQSQLFACGMLNRQEKAVLPM